MLVDVHGHISPPGARRTYPVPPSLLDIEGMIEAKARLGIRLTIVGSPVGGGAMFPIPGVDNYAQTADQVRAYNDLIGDAVGTYPQSLRAYAYVDPFGGDRMLDLAAGLLDDWRFVGLIANTTVAPGLVETDQAAGLTPEHRQRYEQMIPLGRLARPAEIANCVLFLSGEAGSYVNGSTLIVDGGI